MPYRAQIDEHGVVTRYKDTETGEVISAKDYERRIMMQQGGMSYPMQQPGMPQMYATPPAQPMSTMGGQPTGMVSMPHGAYSNALAPTAVLNTQPQMAAPMGYQPPPPAVQSVAYNSATMQPQGQASAPGMGAPQQQQMPGQVPMTGVPPMTNENPLVQPGAQMLNGSAPPVGGGGVPLPPGQGNPPVAGEPAQNKNLRLEGMKGHSNTSSIGYKTHGFLDATSIAILLPTLVLLALIIAAAHKKRLFPWQTIRTFNPPSGLMTPRDYERSFVCPPNLRRHGRLGKRDPQAAWSDADGIVLPFGFLARTHLPITIPLGRLPNKNMFIVAPSGSGKTTLMRAVIKALMAKPCVIIALEAKANDPSMDEKKEGFKFSLLPEAAQAGFQPLYFNPLDADSIHWNPLDLDPITFASSIVQDVNSLPPEEQHWAERDHGYISGLAQLLKWGAVMVAGEDENGQAADVQTLPCNPRGLMRLVNNRRNIVESLRRCKNNPDINQSELNELTQSVSSIIRTDSDWDKNIQGVRGRLRMFKNPNVLRCTEASNIDIRATMNKPSVLIFGAPASMGPDAESLASCFVYQLQCALHTRYGSKSVLPLFAFFDEYQTLNMDIAGRLSAIVRGANGGLTVILQNISQIAKDGSTGGSPTQSGASELKTIFSNAAVRVCLHNADESTAKFFSDEIGKHAIIVPGISDHFDANGFGIFPTSWNRIHSQQVVPRVDADSIKRMEKQHALVYMAPAGDPEFGELKPFMCDLRGIEEIARLHLLHNVSARSSAEAEEAGLGLPGGLPPGVVPGVAAIAGQAGQAIAGPVGAAAAQGVAAAVGGAVMGGAPGAAMAAAPAAAAVAGAVASAVGQAVAGGAARPPFPGSGVPTGQPNVSTSVTGKVLPSGVAPVNPMLHQPSAPMQQSGMQQGAMAAGAMAAGAMAASAMAAGAMPQGAMPQGAMPQGAVPRGGMPQGAMPQQQAPQAPTQQAPMNAAPANGVPSSDRFCTKCGKYPGKGRFCIECGNFMAPAAGAPVAQAGPAPSAPAGAAPGQRAPLTSLHGDMNQYGVPGQQPSVPGQQSSVPGQQPMPRPQPQRPSIEF